jgi:hypothetical protein
MDNFTFFRCNPSLLASLVDLTVRAVAGNHQPLPWKRSVSDSEAFDWRQSRQVCSDGPNWVGSSPLFQVMTEMVSVPKMLCVLNIPHQALDHVQCNIHVLMSGLHFYSLEYLPRKFHNVGFEVFTTLTVKIAVFWEVMLYNLLEVYHHFRWIICLHLAGCLGYSSALKMEVVHSLKTLVNFYNKTVYHHFPEGRTLQLS